LDDQDFFVWEAVVKRKRILVLNVKFFKSSSIDVTLMLILFSVTRNNLPLGFKGRTLTRVGALVGVRNDDAGQVWARLVEMSG
jgi:hypothetical protein